jgi:RNase H-fold protein (predicted Holliday junction resolvase)
MSAMRSLSARLVPPATLLGVDFGQRYLGFALSDGSNLVARPLTVYDESTVSRVFGFGEDSLSGLIARHRVQALIVGLPFTSGMAQMSTCANSNIFATRSGHSLSHQGIVSVSECVCVCLYKCV